METTQQATKVNIEKTTHTNATTRVHFVDRGQDFLHCDIDDIGEIVDCNPVHRAVWLGCIIDLETMKEGKYPEYINPRKGRSEIRYRVTKIESINREE